jgi:TolB-like protein
VTSLGLRGRVLGHYRIVVLPFENLGADDDVFFAERMTEEITARLAAVNRLQVISRTSAPQYADTERSIPEIGRELGVGYVLEGTIRWAPLRDDPRFEEMLEKYDIGG